MITVEYGNFVYYLMILFMIATSIGCVYLLANKSEKFSSNFIFGLLLSAFILHFIKLLFEPYRSNLPNSITAITFENLCAVSTIVFPWFYLSKNKFLRDYVVIVGIISGMAVFILPTEAQGKVFLSFDVMRFYYGHLILFLAPMLMLYTRQHEMKLSRIFFIPFILYGTFTLMFFNEVFLTFVGIVDGSMETILDPNFRNPSFVFGPTDDFQHVAWVLTMFVPTPLKTLSIGGGYLPVIWLIIPLYIYVCLFGFVIYLLSKPKLNIKPITINEHVLEQNKVLESR